MSSDATSSHISQVWRCYCRHLVAIRAYIVATSTRAQDACFTERSIDAGTHARDATNAGAISYKRCRSAISGSPTLVLTNDTKPGGRSLRHRLSCESRAISFWNVLGDLAWVLSLSCLFFSFASYFTCLLLLHPLCSHYLLALRATHSLDRPYSLLLV